MKVKDLLGGMENRAFDETFLQDLREFSDAKDYGDMEKDYQTGYARMQIVLTGKQMQELTRMEEIYEKRREYAAQYGFKCGLFGAFRQFFGASSAEDGGFLDLVCDDLMMQPKMQRHHDNYANIELRNEIDRTIMDTLSKEDQEYMVSIACAWQQRVYSAAFDGFYCSYRAAYDIMEQIIPLVKVQNADKILAMEYLMGFIKPYSEVERLRDLAA